MAKKDKILKEGDPGFVFIDTLGQLETMMKSEFNIYLALSRVDKKYLVIASTPRGSRASKVQNESLVEAVNLIFQDLKEQKQLEPDPDLA